LQHGLHNAVNTNDQNVKSKSLMQNIAQTIYSSVKV